MGEAKKRKLLAQQQPPPKHKPGDAKIVLEAADAFRECSRPFCTKMVNLPTTANIEKVVKGDMGGMIASATNLALAIELYIKALRIIQGQGPMGIHELDTLFQNLRAPLRRAIDKTYQTALKPIPARNAWVGVSIRHTDMPSTPPQLAPRDSSLSAVLKRSRDVFEKWRYLYDQGGPGMVKRLEYEYYCLGVAADALREHVVKGLDEAGKAERPTSA